MLKRCHRRRRLDVLDGLFWLPFVGSGPNGNKLSSWLHFSAYPTTQVGGQKGRDFPQRPSDSE
jgi:hypothetical protein